MSHSQIMTSGRQVDYGMVMLGIGVTVVGIAAATLLAHGSDRRFPAPPLPRLAASTAPPECLPGRCSPTAQLSTTAVPSKTELAARHKSCGALAIALASENMFASGRAFWLTGALANGGLIPDAELFSYIMYIMMTEGVTFALSCATTFVMVLEWTGPRGHFALAGLLLGLLCLTRFSFLVPTTVLAGLIVFNSWIGQRSLRSVRNDAIVF